MPMLPDPSDAEVGPAAPAIRSAKPDDVPAIAAIYAAAVTGGTASFELVAPDGEEMLRRYRALRDDGFPYIVAEQDGRILGYAYAGPYRPRPAYRFTVEVSIYVTTEAHRRGVGRALLTELAGRAATGGFRQMIAVIGDSLQSASIGLHRAMGFTFVGTVHSVGFKHGRWLDSVLMQLAIGDGDATPPPEGA